MAEKPPIEDNPLLVDAIRSAIERGGGQIPFRDYMELALYHPAFGYYHAEGEKTGRQGDYITSPLISPLFGQTIRRFLERQFGRGVPRRILELGAGDGTLASQLASTGEYTILERSADFRERQRQRLGDQASWVDHVPDGFEGVILSNELLDALPVHRLDGDRELYVGWDGGLRERLGAYSTPAIDAYFERLGLRPAGQAEVNLDALELMSAAYAAARAGVILTIDYGYDADELFLRHPQGTFLTYYQHTTDDRPYEGVGRKDMTSHVDFTALQLAGEAAGWRTGKLTSQAEFLIEHGIGDLLLELQAQVTDAANYYRARQEVMSILNPAGMGGFKVLIQEKS